MLQQRLRLSLAAVLLRHVPNVLPDLLPDVLQHLLSTLHQLLDVHVRALRSRPVPLRLHWHVGGLVRRVHGAAGWRVLDD